MQGQRWKIIAKPITVCAVIAVLIMSVALIASSASDQTGPPAPTAARAPMAFAVGDRLDQTEVHVLSAPGRYGLGPGLPDSRYAVAHGKLIRIDPASLRVLSILRDQPRRLD